MTTTTTRKAAEGGGKPERTSAAGGVESRVMATVARVMGVDAADLDPKLRFVEDLRADSLRVMELLLELQDEFSIEIPDEALEEIRSVGDAVAYVARRVGA